MKPFSLLIKPSSADCNLRCNYCFYLDRASLYPDDRQPRMSLQVLERVIASFFASPQSTYSFAWQGGEPTLMGLPFFREAVRLQHELGRPGMVVANGFQTNGVLLNDDWARFFAESQFLVGVSVDGPPHLHDQTRRTSGGKGSHARIMAGLNALRRQRVEFNTLTLVNRANVAHPETIYDYLCDLGILHHQYIECVEFDAEGRQQPFAISGSEWGDFVCRIFDRWYARDAFRVSVRLFDTILAQLVDGISNTCVAGRSCDQYFVVEHNGDIYPCDFHVRHDLLLGNIMQDNWEDLQVSPLYRKFAAAKTAWSPACEVCPWQRFCNGDCPKNRPGASTSLSHLCSGWKKFYAHTMPRFEELAQEVRRARRM